MDSINSFKGYGKVDEIEQRAFQKKTRRRYIIIGVSVVILAAVIIGAVGGIAIHRRNSSSSPAMSPPPRARDVTPATTLATLCGVTEYPSSCLSSLRGFNTTDPEVLFKLSLGVAERELQKLAKLPIDLAGKSNVAAEKEALIVCGEVLDDAADRLNDTSTEMAAGEGKKISPAMIHSFESWLSAALTDIETCLDGLSEINSTLLPEFNSKTKNSTELASNSLAIVARVLKVLANFDVPIHRRLLSNAVDGEGFPVWLGGGDRRLLQQEGENSTEQLITVAKDGTGDYMTIQAAVDKVPKKSKTRFVIRIKEGTFVENVVLDKSKWNVMMVGEGKTKTIISGSKNFIDGTPTFATATLAVAGRGFIAKDIQFLNTAGPQKHQAVAMRSGSDMSVFYRCSFDAYQDTLYAHSNRQFYRDCDITGTIDFIFGNSAVVFQNCLIQPRQPLPNQFNTITAQGKKDPNQNSGISIQKCVFTAKDINMTAPTYLGRPWKDYSTTVVMRSEIGSFVHRLGWREWVTGVDPPTTIFYGEYQNSGPGSVVDERVKWAGFRPVLTDNEAMKFSVQSFIEGRDWLVQTGVTFD